MEYVKIDKTICDFAQDILEMEQKIFLLERENKELRKYKEDYFKLLKHTISHNKIMMQNLVLAYLQKPKVPKNIKSL